MKDKFLAFGILIVAIVVSVFIYINSRNIISDEPVESASPVSEEEQTACAQVITEASNPETGETKEFPTPCDVPEGWDIVESTPSATM